MAPTSAGQRKGNDRADVLIVGGGTGGCAAALAAASLRKRVVVTESTDWVGGQLTSQAVPPDEHSWIEQFGCTRRYRSYRDGVRQYYRDHYPLTQKARSDPFLNPGSGLVSRLCHEPRVGVAVLEQMMAYPRTAGFLEVRLRRKPVGVDTDGDLVKAVSFLNMETGEEETIEGDYILDATELGDLLPMAEVEYVSGFESQRDTGEPHALSGDPQPETVQSLTWVFAMGHDPQGHHTIDRPQQYDRWRERFEDNVVFPNGLEEMPFIWRRIVCRDHYPPGAMPHEVTLVVWGQNGYSMGNIIDKPEVEAGRYLEEARQLSLSFLCWLQTEAPRPGGGVGYPGLFLCPDVMGTADGLAKHPYIRESRRINALFTVTESHVGAEARDSGEAERFFDSVGVGSYHIDLHASTAGGVREPSIDALAQVGQGHINLAALPFQIPLGALIPVRVENLLPGCKNIGTTHLTNGCFRLHPVEWNIGEAAGLLAGFCLERKVTPIAVREDRQLLSDFQDLCLAQGFELEWPKLRAEEVRLTAETRRRKIRMGLP